MSINGDSSRFPGLGAREEEQLLPGQAVRQQQCQGSVQQGAQQPVQCPLLQVLWSVALSSWVSGTRELFSVLLICCGHLSRPCEQEDCDGAASRRQGDGSGSCNNQDKAAEQACQPLPQVCHAQGVPQDGQGCQEPGNSSRMAK